MLFFLLLYVQTNKWQARQDAEKTMARNGEFLEDEAKSLEEEAIISL